MKKKIIMTSLILGVILVGAIITYYTVFNNKKNEIKYEEELFAILLEDKVTGEYFESDLTQFPKTGYTYNSSKSYCRNGSSLNWNDSTKTMGVTVTGTEKCYIYFDAE